MTNAIAISASMNEAATSDKVRKPGSGRPGVPRRKPHLSPIPRISLVSPTTTEAGIHPGSPQWRDREYEQLCFDLLHEQRTNQAAPKGTASTESVPALTGSVAELRLPDRTATATPADYCYDSDLFRRQRTSSADLPDAKRWCSQFTCAYIEVLNGKRGFKQIERWLEERISRQVQSEIAPTPRRRPRRLSIHSLHVSEPIDSVIEGSCLLKTNTKYRSMTFRFEGWDGKWMCTHLRIHA